MTRTRVAAFGATAPKVAVRYAAVVDLTHRIVDPADIVVESPASLPVATLRYLYPSRYCQADLVQKRAWELFGAMPRGYAQVLAVRDWVRSNIAFRIGVSSSTTTVIDTLEAGAGVCRDFAHTMIAHCRALNYPARFVTGVDYGADPALGPPDFHAYAEVFLGGAWYLFDADRHLARHGAHPHRHRPRRRRRIVRHDLRPGAHRDAQGRVQRGGRSGLGPARTGAYGARGVHSMVTRRLRPPPSA